MTPPLHEPEQLDSLANAADPTGVEEPDRIDRVLMPNGAPTSNEDKTQLFELYKLMVQTSEALVARRQGTNTFFLTANGLLLTAIGLFVRQGADTKRHGLVIAILCLTGLIVAWGWRTLLISFGQLNKGKFAVILRMEKALAASIFDAEWEALDRGENKHIYRSFTESEKRVPAVFMAIYGIAFAVGLLIVLDWLPL
ncbi:RipA family octameric membrane protein [Micromonospora wenchangensis]|uniref:RipA family octameric membrane protein n=1 Tax=Micromonospora wenchangensis TaxID=1185415 RepID=UPI0038295F77